MRSCMCRFVGWLCIADAVVAAPLNETGVVVVVVAVLAVGDVLGDPATAVLPLFLTAAVVVVVAVVAVGCCCWLLLLVVAVLSVDR